MINTPAIRALCIVVSAVGILVCSTTMAEPNNRPQPERPQPQAPGQNRTQADGEANGDDNGNGSLMTRRPAEDFRRKALPSPDEKIWLSMNDVPVDEKVIDFIANNTGKVVIPVNLMTLRAKKITVYHVDGIERRTALNLVFQALQLNGIGISEKDDVIILDDIQNLRQKPVPVYGAEEDIRDLQALGNYIVKVYRLRKANAQDVGDRLAEVQPDFATVQVDPNSNQIVFFGTVATAQHYQRLIDELDTNFITVKTVTFRLAYADATAVADQIWELFETSATAQAGQPRQTQRPPAGGRNTQRGAAGGGVSGTPAGLVGPGPVVELRVSVNVQQNSVTVSAEPEKIDAITHLIEQNWDLPRSKETFRVYTLHYTDPIKMRDLISSLLGSGGAGSRNQAGRVGGAQPGRAGQPGGGAAGAGISEVLGDIYRVEAYPDNNTIIVLSKTQEALDYLDAFILANDLPSTVGLPQVVELKHANAVGLADELNVLLAEPGTGTGLVRPGEGLNAEGLGGVGTSGDTGGVTGGARSGTPGGAGGTGGTIEFPWQRARQRDDQSPESSLIGKVRIVPIVRQNALAVLAPVAQRHAIIEIIRQFDRPGRQVMISAVIAEVQLTNDLALGLRFSSAPLSPTFSDNAIGGSVGFTGTNENVVSKLFDTSVLDVNMDLNVILQALSQKTNVRILQEPRIFTADNQEASFFHGQDIPFITNSNTTDIGGLTQSFDYQQVGVLLNVRPRITVERDVDMEIRLMLSAVVPGQTLFGGAILDRRETNTKVIVKNAQTIVLSGLLKDVDSKVTRGVPLLADIPLLGELFKSRENSKSTSELVAFITPIVVDNPSENDENFNKKERESLRDMSVPLEDRDVKYQREHLREKMIAPKQADGTPIITESVEPGRTPGRAVPHTPPNEKNRPSPQSPQSWNRTSVPPSEPPQSPPRTNPEAQPPQEPPPAPAEPAEAPVDIDELSDDSSP